MGTVNIGIKLSQKNKITNLLEKGKSMNSFVQEALDKKINDLQKNSLKPKNTYLHDELCSNCTMIQYFDIPKGLKVENFLEKNTLCPNCGCLLNGDSS